MERRTPEPGSVLTREQFDAMTTDERRAHFGRMSKEEREDVRRQIDTLVKEKQNVVAQREEWRRQLDAVAKVIAMAAADGDLDAVIRNRQRHDAIPVIMKAADARIAELHRE